MKYVAARLCSRGHRDGLRSEAARNYQLDRRATARRLFVRHSATRTGGRDLWSHRPHDTKRALAPRGAADLLQHRAGFQPRRINARDGSADGSIWSEIATWALLAVAHRAIPSYNDRSSVIRNPIRRLQTDPMTQTNATIAKKARSRAEADFATWLMMAKLGSFDDLPPNAQDFLNRYRARFGEMSEAKSKTVAVNEIYLTYYKEMGGTGAAPEPEPRPSAAGGDNVVKFQKPRPPPKAAAASSTSRAKRPMPAFLIFAAMVAVIAAYKFLVK